jgi:FlaA1/EpsC-like NDP-sugar epimerase
MNFEQSTLNKILGREEYDLEKFFQEAAFFYEQTNIVVTGAMGSLGTALNSFIEDYDIECTLTNVDIAYERGDSNGGISMDVSNPFSVKGLIASTNPDYIFHFAADKHAPTGERTPQSTIDINITGTQVILDSIKDTDAQLILSSTCKSCNPETVYGASKLIAERMCLNAGHSVARYYNVVESSDNVFEIWNNQEDQKKHLVMNCNRYFISIREALALTLFVGMQSSGRYTVNPGKIRNMLDVYHDIYGRHGVVTPARRGDRLSEIRVSTSEYVDTINKTCFDQIFNEHDAVL